MAKTMQSISAKDFLPKRRTIPTLRAAAKKCHGCHLYKEATQTVFGEGASKAHLMIVGEIPGDKEDKLGEPFVGPAGILMRKLISNMDLDLEDIYFTNVVKHFKFAYFNQKRLHRSPITREIKACLPWLEAEINVVQPEVILCLGAVAAKALIDKDFHITKQRGRCFTFSEAANIQILATYHPSAILRANDAHERHRLKRLFTNDLKKAILLAKK